MLDPTDDANYMRMLGDRLRAIRRQKNLSLSDVEESTNQEFKASVLGAYERGERAISVPRLERLAHFYRAPVDQLLPRSITPSDESLVDLTEEGAAARDGVKLDIAALSELKTSEAKMLWRYATMIQVQRQDFNGKVLTIRHDDLRAVACILGVEIDQAQATLGDLDLLYG